MTFATSRKRLIEKKRVANLLERPVGKDIVDIAVDDTCNVSVFFSDCFFLKETWENGSETDVIHTAATSTK
jgi:hypothetical protein